MNYKVSYATEDKLREAQDNLMLVDKVHPNRGVFLDMFKSVRDSNLSYLKSTEKLYIGETFWGFNVPIYYTFTCIHHSTVV